MCKNTYNDMAKRSPALFKKLIPVLCIIYFFLQALTNTESLVTQVCTMTYGSTTPRATTSTRITLTKSTSERYSPRMYHEQSYVITLKVKCTNEGPFLRYRYDALEPRHGISNNVVCATSKGSDQPAHMRSLIRAFASRMNVL